MLTLSCIACNKPLANSEMIYVDHLKDYNDMCFYCLSKSAETGSPLSKNILSAVQQAIMDGGEVLDVIDKEIIDCPLP